MKKIFILSLVALTGCTSLRDNVPYTTSAPSIKIEPVITPTVTVGDKITGKAVCSDILFVFHDIPSEQTYGATINAQNAVTPNTACAAAAVYNALDNSNNADVLIAPKFTSITDSFLCLPLIGCLIKTQNVFVDAYEGKLKYNK